MIGKLICWITGKHKRGKRVTPKDVQVENIVFVCPRCGKQWERKAKK